MKPIILIMLILLIHLSSKSSDACTIVMIANGDTILAGNNEDWYNPNTVMWFYPPSNGEFGRVCFGFDNAYEITEGGMNDQGLFIDINAVDDTGWESDSTKLNYQGDLLDFILANCSCVNDVFEFFQKYNVKELNTCRFPIADALGNSAIIEWGNGKLQFIKRSGIYQISTNTIESNYTKEDYPCERYHMAHQILKTEKDIGFDAVRSVLSATANEFFWPTIYSNIYDLHGKKIYLYNFHNFEEVVIFDLEEELKKGKHSFAIPSLFKVTTQAALQYEIYRIKSGKNELLRIIDQSGVAEAIAQYHILKQDQYRKIKKIDLGENEINLLGYELLWSDRFEEAIKIFKLNVLEHPDSWNVYDSLGEAYLKIGKDDLAIAAYRKSLELNPHNTNVQEVLKKLKNH